MHAPGPAPTTTAVQSWQRALAAAYGTAAELLADLDLKPADCGVSAAAALRFPLRVPRGYAARMRRGDPTDPLLRQVLPIGDEERAVPGFSDDPVGDLTALRGHGLIQKYAGRALLIATGACAIHCRYCFRREFPYADHAQSAAALRDNLADLAADPGITEVILSGGDPLLRTDDWLRTLLRQLDGLGHVARLRIHTRLPIVLPERITDALLGALAAFSRSLVVVVHCNHPREIDPQVRTACRRLRDAGVTLLNQSVLLRGVNADADVLVELSTRLFEAGVLPYYLHQLDAVNGAAHFAVSDSEALALNAAQSARLPGYLVPRLVREVAGAPAKTPLS